jgi:hypothetical protein
VFAAMLPQSDLELASPNTWKARDGWNNKFCETKNEKPRAIGPGRLLEYRGDQKSRSDQKW